MACRSALFTTQPTSPRRTATNVQSSGATCSRSSENSARHRTRRQMRQGRGQKTRQNFSEAGREGQSSSRRNCVRALFSKSENSGTCSAFGCAGKPGCAASHRSSLRHWEFLVLRFCGSPLLIGGTDMATTEPLPVRRSSPATLFLRHFFPIARWAWKNRVSLAPQSAAKTPETISTRWLRRPSLRRR